jgi:glc operon protein GlcG
VRFVPSLSRLLAAAALFACTLQVSAQAPAPTAAPAVPQYGPNVTQDQARRAIAAAMVDARRIGVPMAVAIVDTAGQLVAFERMENTQTASISVSQDKAVSAAMYRRPTKAFQDGLAAGGNGLRILTLRNANAVEGGIPLVVDGRIIGAIGVSGGAAEQDGEVARAGLAGLGR